MYKDREEAGRMLAEAVAGRGFQDLCLLAVPRGGVVVAAPIADKLNTRLEVLVTRKIGHPANPEVAVGAVMADGSAVLDEGLIASTGVNREYLEQAIEEEFSELKRRIRAYTGTTEPPRVTGRTAIVVDDGIATGYTIRAAIKWLKTLEPARIILAVPVAPPETVRELAEEVAEVICPQQPELFMAVGMYYEEFPQNTDQEIMSILAKTNLVRQ